VVAWREPYELRGSSTVLRGARGETPWAHSPQYLRRQSSGGGEDAEIGTGMDREATATQGEHGKERDGEGVGTKVPGLSTGSQEADRDRAGECQTIQRTGSRIVGWEKKSQQQPTARRLEPVRTRLVGVLPTGRSASPHPGPGRVDPAAYSEVLLAEMAQQAGPIAQTKTPRDRGARSGDRLPQRRSVADVSAPGAEQRAEQRSAAPAWLSIPQRS